jgi:acetylornithine deacetylase/succinyl-diaminopimelate desuccinylase-like protein
MPSFKDSADYLPELAEFAAIPSVSRESSPPDMRAAAQWLAGQLAFANARLLPTDGNPVVAGEWLGAPGAPTVLVYGHYDVQPTGSLDEWRTPPFELTVADSKAYGRGATDDKGPILVVLKTAQAFIEQFGGLPLNVKFLFEGEEEIGSPNLPAFLRANAEQFAAEKGGAAAYTIDPRHPAVTAARDALAAVYPGQDVIHARIGGTLPGTVLFEEVLDAKTLFFSFSIADEMLHAPNEFLRVRRLGEGMRAWSLPWRELSQQQPGAMSASAQSGGIR